MQGPAQRIVLSSARKFINMGALSRLWNLFKKLHSADIASILNHLTNRERLIIFNVLYEQDREKAAEVVSELEPEDAAQILKEIPIKQITEIFHLIASDDIAPILQQLPEEMQSAVLDEMEEKPSEEVKELLHYEEETAGRIMSTNFYALNQETNVSDAITAMQLEGDVESAFYLYVVDDEGHLVGVVSLRQLLFARPNTKLKEIMNREVISVRTDTDQEFVARAVADYNLVAIPVVDEANKLVGVVTVDDVIDVIDKEATEDIYKMVSLDSSDRVQDSPFSSIKKRLPFLLISLATASLAPLVVNFFKGTIQQAVTLAVMMPLVAALGGVAGNQTIAIMVREIAIGQADWLSAHKILLKEMLVGLGNGLVIGSLLGAATFLLFNNPYLGLIMGLAIIINLFVAALLGTLIPLTLKLLRLDPALGSVNFLTMCTDSVGMLSLLGLGTIFLKHI
ncbi:MAG: magnesium transporter [Candidatus Aminicenantes bacterium 4484_214]|nr:MAG: magnesium transporter [Candidatus Aminicenantes bacterium 4484_214]HDJ22586.1 magnesium transporter [Candidatus Aminicenantes bacterium]